MFFICSLPTWNEQLLFDLLNYCVVTIVFEQVYPFTYDITVLSMSIFHTVIIDAGIYFANLFLFCKAYMDFFCSKLVTFALEQ